MKKSESVEPATPALVTFICDRYPFLKIIVRREEGKPDHVVRFVDRRYVTSDPDEIAVLRKQSDVRVDAGRVYVCEFNGCSFSTTEPREFAQHILDEHS